MTSQPYFFFSTNLLSGRSWKFMMFQAIAAIGLGLFFLLHYASALVLFAILLGLMLIGCGAQGFLQMALFRKFKFGYAVYSLFLLLAGLFLVIDPLRGSSILIRFLGIWFIIHSIELFAGAALDRMYAPGFRILVVANGLVTLAFGVLIALLPVAVIGIINWLFAFFLIFYGAVTLGVALRLRRICRAASEQR